MMMELVAGLIILTIMALFITVTVALVDNLMLDSVLGTHLTKKLKKRFEDD